MYGPGAFQAMQGLGAGGFFSLALTILGDIWTGLPRRTSRWRGCTSAARLPVASMRPDGLAVPAEWMLDGPAVLASDARGDRALGRVDEPRAAPLVLLDDDGSVLQPPRYRPRQPHHCRGSHGSLVRAVLSDERV
jgi:hypothetical protein